MEAVLAVFWPTVGGGDTIVGARPPDGIWGLPLTVPDARAGQLHWVRESKDAAGWPLTDKAVRANPFTRTLA